MWSSQVASTLEKPCQLLMVMPWTNKGRLIVNLTCQTVWVGERRSCPLLCNQIDRVVTIRGRCIIPQIFLETTFPFQENQPNLKYLGNILWAMLMIPHSERIWKLRAKSLNNGTVPEPDHECSNLSADPCPLSLMTYPLPRNGAKDNMAILIITCISCIYVHLQMTLNTIYVDNKYTCILNW